MNLPFSLRELRYFVVVAEEGQMTRAAGRLNVAQPALSQTIAKLEQQVGADLLERHARGVRATAAGEAFLERARIVLAATEEAICAVEPWAERESRLCFGFKGSIQALTRPLRRGLMERHPDIAIEVRHLGTFERLRELRAGRLDVELLYPAPAQTFELVSQTILRSPRYVVLSENHRLAREQQLRFEQIAEETFPARHPSVPEECARDAWLTSYRGADPKLSAEAPQGLDQLWTLIYANKAIAVLPRFLLSAAVGEGVRAIPLLDVEPVEVALARRRADRRPIVTALFEIAGDSAEAHRRLERGRPRIELRSAGRRAVTVQPT
jgi:DNA-binding transcriptional LysR family regulator